MKRTFSSVALLLILVIPLTTMFVGTKKVGASPSYDSEAAVNYAETWWNGRNPAYNNYGDLDCANFVSQCLIAGGLNLGICPYVDAWGCIPFCDNLHQYLVNYLGAQHEVRRRGEAEPSWFSKGDPAIFGDDSDNWRHAVFAVAEDESNYVLCNAHSQNVYHISISSFFEANPDFTLCNYYHISDQEPLDIQLTALPSPTRDIDGATISAYVTSSGVPVEGAYVEFSFEPEGTPHNGFDDDDDPDTPPVAEISGTTNELGEFQVHWGYYDVCIVFEQIITFHATASKEGYTSISDSCTLNVLPVGEAPYPEPLYGEVTMSFPCGPHNVYVTLSPATGIITSGQTVYFDIQIGREIDYESIEELDWDAIWMIPVFKNKVGFRSETNTITVSLPDTHEVQAEVIDDEVMVEVKHSLLSDDWIPISSVEDMDNIISAVTWLRRLNAISKGNWIGLAAGFIPDAIATLATALYGEELGHGPEGEIFDPTNEDVALDLKAFGVGKFGVEGFRIRLPVKFLGEGTIDVNFHVAFAFVSHNQYVMNYAGAQFEPLSFTVRPRALDAYLLVDLSGSFADDLPIFKVQAPNMISNLKATYPGARFGLGKFEDYPIWPFGDASSGDKAYERIIDLTSDTDAVLSCISSLFTRYGADGPQSQLPALYQAATGAGQDLSGVGFPGASIPPGQQANFRDGATKLFILWTDAPFHNPGDPGTIPYPGPSFDQTVEAIKALDPPMVIGISSGSGGVEDLRRMAIATGALAPAGGVDTNGDGIIDILEGEPLVCAISSSGYGIAEAIEALVGAAAILPIADANGPYEGEVGKAVTLDGSGSFDSDGYIALYEWDFEGDGVFDFSSAESTTSHIYATAFTGVVILRVTDNEGNTDTDEASITIVQTDNIPPTTTLEIGEPKYVDPMDNIYVTSTTPFTLTAEDNPGGIGVESIFYRIYNTTYDTGWLEYSAPFYLTGLSDGEYSIDYYSTDTIGNTELTNTATVILDNTPPSTTLTIGEPKYISDTTYVTPDTPFTLEATDTGSGIYSTAYRIYNTTDDSGWQTYTVPFYLTSLTDGAYTIEYNSTDNVQNTEITHAINVTLFSWNYIYQDTYGRGTTLKINLAHKFFQFIRPDKDYGIRNATYMKQCGRAIIICHCDKQLRLITVSVDTKIDFCYVMAWDLQTRKCYLLIDKGGIE